MFDLMGFWVSVTLMVVGIVIPIVVGLIYLLRNVLHTASRERFDLWLLLATKSMLSCGDKVWVLSDMVADRYTNIAAVSAIVSAVYWVLALGVAKSFNCEANSFLELISVCSTSMAPFLGWVGILVGGYAAIYVLGRKTFDVYYTIKDKLDKLGG